MNGKRAGRKYEAIGTLMVVVGLLFACAAGAGGSKVGLTLGLLLLGVGFVVFLVGRFK